MVDPNLIQVFTEPLEEHQIDYMVTGSVAAIIYGQPRLTHDVDLVMHLTEASLDAFINSFPIEQFYCPPETAIRLELNREARAHFNLIHHESGFKADCYLLGHDPLQVWGLKQRRRIELNPESSIWVAPPEYVILRKLEYYREGESTKHLTDIAAMLEVSEMIIDHDFLTRKIDELGLCHEWAKAQKSSPL